MLVEVTAAAVQVKVPRKMVREKSPNIIKIGKNKDFENCLFISKQSLKLN